MPCYCNSDSNSLHFGDFSPKVRVIQNNKITRGLKIADILLVFSSFLSFPNSLPLWWLNHPSKSDMSQFGSFLQVDKGANIYPKKRNKNHLPLNPKTPWKNEFEGLKPPQFLGGNISIP